MEVKIISGYGENTFQMEEADAMSLLNNAMRFHNKIKTVGGIKNNSDAKTGKEEKTEESITAHEFVKKMQEKPHSRNDSLFGTDGRKNRRKKKRRRMWNILTDTKAFCISNAISAEEKKGSAQKKKLNPINVTVATKWNL